MDWEGWIEVSSRPGELPPESLTEPYLIVSHHTALLKQLG